MQQILITLHHCTRTAVTTEGQQVVQKAPAETHRMAAFALIRRRHQSLPLRQPLGDLRNGRRTDARHVGQRDDPARSITRFGNAMGKAHAHTLIRIRADPNRTAFNFEHLAQGVIPRPHHGQHFQTSLTQIACGMGSHRHAILQRMQQLVAAKARTRAGRKQQCNRE